MGGFMAVQGAAADPAILAFGLISAADMGANVPQPLAAEREPALRKSLSASYAAEAMAPLAGCTPEGLARKTIAHAPEWSFLSKTSALKARPALIVTSDDGLTPVNTAFGAALRKAGNQRVTELHLPTDHAYSDQRTALSVAVLSWLAALPSQ